MEKKSNKKLFILAGTLLLLVGVIGITFAYFSAGGTQEQANTFSSGCLNIELTNESASISLDNVYPITDIEGLEGTSYDFTIKNNCSTETNYQINLESLNEVANSLSADYIKVSLSSDTVDNVISILSDNTSVTPELEGAYESYNLYTTSIGAGETKTYHLKIWIDYDATVEQAASKVYQSKINVIANPDTEVIDTLEAKFSIKNREVTASLSNNVTSASYCVTEGNICTPNTSVTIENNSYTVELEESEKEQVVCTKLNGTSKIICSEPLIAKEPTASEVILASKTIDNSRSGAITGVLTTNGNGKLYSVADDYGTSYVYAGNVTDNWVKWAGFYWRIIRINGDGSLRLIYNGTSTAATGEGTQIRTSAFNTNANDNAYVGYMYGSAGASSYSATHTNTTNSIIKGILDNWYKTNIEDKNYSKDVSTEQGFCNDRRIASSSETFWYIDTKRGYGTNTTAYAPFSRILNTDGNWDSTQTPTLKCNQTNDYFTVSGSSKGNHKLTYPVGLITSDEVVLAGGFGGTANQSYYLYTGQVYWTMSPSYFNGNNALVFIVYNDGYLNYRSVNNEYGVRPVINLKANVQITAGNGTSNSPYVVEG